MPKSTKLPSLVKSRPFSFNNKNVPSVLKIIFPIIFLLYSICPNSLVYAEDLILSGNDVMVIENTTYTQTGNIFIRDNAKLTLKNATLVLNISYHEEFVMTVSDSGTLESTNSIIKTSLTSSMGNEIAVVNCSGSSNIIFKDSNSSDNVVYLQLFANFTGNASVSNSTLSTLSITFLPLGSSTISVLDSSFSDLTFRFNDNYQGDFSNLKKGPISSWLYIKDGYNISLQNITSPPLNLVCDGPAQIVLHNSDINVFALNAPQSACTMTAIDSTLFNLKLHGIRDTIASFSDLKPGLYTDWKLSDHRTGEFLPDIVLINTTVNKGWSINIFANSNISINDSILDRLGLYSSNANVTVTNSTVDEFMLYNSTESTSTFDATSINLINVFVPPNSTMIKGNINFTSNAQISNWFSPSSIKRNYPIVVTDQSSKSISGADLNLYLKNGTLIWSGQTDSTGAANVDIEFDDNNHSDVLTLETTNNGKTVNRDIKLLSSTPINITVDAIAPITTASPVGGIYNSAQNVTLSANEQATIYYTMDGSNPTEVSSIYTAPISVTTTSMLMFFAKDLAGNSETVKTQNYTIVIPGDINNDKKFDLVDAILALQVITGILPAQIIFKETDINGDGKIGLSEAIYILQKVAGMRQP